MTSAQNDPVALPDDVAVAWCGKALVALSSLWDAQNHTARRDSLDISEAEADKFRPTATFHYIVALDDLGVYGTSKSFDKHNKRIKTDYLLAEPVKAFSTPAQILARLLGLGPNETWLERLSSLSIHLDDKASKTQSAIMAPYLFRAMRTLCMHCDPVSTDHKAQIVAALKPASALIFRLLNGKNEIDLLEEETFSPHILANVAQAIDERCRLLELLKEADEENSRVTKLHGQLKFYFRVQCERLMAHRAVKHDPGYDVVSLAYALRGLSLLDSGSHHRSTPFFRACVRAVAEDQRDDGTWHGGMSVSLSPNGATAQLPSVDIALQLSEAVFTRQMLHRYHVYDLELMRTAVPALRRTVAFLHNSLHNDCGQFHDNTVMGWSSDRTSSIRSAHTWINALAARLFHNLFLMERCLTRARVLESFPVRWPSRPIGSVSLRLEDLDEGVAEPDKVVAPRTRVMNSIAHILGEAKSRTFLRPPKNGASYVLFGPPGSGKTYFVQKIAEALDWPLVSVGPGHFIEKGLELIEAVSSDVFKRLSALDHAVVLLDECDELFRDRDAPQQERNILSFATAAMLPKLQQLNDDRRIILFMGTNFLHRMDIAVRRPGRFDELLLLDRPDESARSSLLRHILSKEDKLAAYESQLGDWVKQTAGWMVKEVKDFALAHCAGKTPSMALIEDYIDWMRQAGIQDLFASRLSDQEKKGIIRRWRSICNDEDAFENVEQVKKLFRTK